METEHDQPRGYGMAKRVALAVLAAAGVVVLYGAIVFTAAGRIDLPIYWAYLIIAGVMTLVGFLIVDPGLIRERRRPGKGGRDMITVHLAKVALLAMLVIAPMDMGRCHVSDTIPTGLRIAGLVMYSAGLGLMIACMAINRYFSSVVRIQTDRGHELITWGPYAVVRHPGYVGFLALSIGSGLALGSWWGCAPVAVFAGLILRRCVIEDRFLRREFAGYEAYAAKVRWRLVPGVW